MEKNQEELYGEIIEKQAKRHFGTILILKLSAIAIAGGVALSVSEALTEHDEKMCLYSNILMGNEKSQHLAIDHQMAVVNSKTSETGISAHYQEDFVIRDIVEPTINEDGVYIYPEGYTAMIGHVCVKPIKDDKGDVIHYELAQPLKIEKDGNVEYFAPAGYTLYDNVGVKSVKRDSIVIGSGTYNFDGREVSDDFNVENIIKLK